VRVAQLIVAHPQLQAPIYTAMQRQHGYAAVQSVAKFAVQSQSHQLHDASNLTHVKDGPLGPTAVVPDNYVGPQPPNAVRESDYQRMVHIYQRIESGESSVSFDLSNFFKQEDGSNLSPTDPLAYAKAGADAAKFRQQYLGYIRELVKTPAGLQLLTRLDSSKHKTTIAHNTAGNFADDRPGDDGYIKPDGTLGAGTDVTVRVAPNQTEWDGETCDQGFRPWMKDRPKWGFYHELVHAYHFNRGDTEPDGHNHAACVKDFGWEIGKKEFQAVGLGPYAANAVTENAIRAQMGVPLRTTYSGATWDFDPWGQQKDDEEPPRRSPAR
jgi:hypothetical protein